MKRKATDVETMAVFPSQLGWMAIVGRGDAVRRLVFGYPSPEEAVAALGDVNLASPQRGRFNPRLVARLKAYARRGGDDFRDVELELGRRTDFQLRVVEACRRIPCGGTSTYGLLAAVAGYPRAARAVGSVMATNPVPLIVPCHRVLASAGRLGGYSSRQGLSMKSRLLNLEAASKTSARPKSAKRRRVPAAR